MKWILSSEWRRSSCAIISHRKNNLPLRMTRSQVAHGFGNFLQRIYSIQTGLTCLRSNISFRNMKSSRLKLAIKKTTFRLVSSAANCNLMTWPIDPIQQLDFGPPPQF